MGRSNTLPLEKRPQSPATSKVGTTPKRSATAATPRTKNDEVNDSKSKHRLSFIPHLHRHAESSEPSTAPSSSARVAESTPSEVDTSSPTTSRPMKAAAKASAAIGIKTGTSNGSKADPIMTSPDTSGRNRYSPIKSSNAAKEQYANNSRGAYKANRDGVNRSKSTASTSKRPGIPQRANSVQTRYINMLLSMDDIPRFHNILASFFGWILLAGFVIFPGTFTSIQTLEDDPDVANNSAASTILHQVKSIPLLVVAGVCCGIGAAGMVWLWWRWRNNFVWLLNRIFLPGCLNGLAGFISTVANVYSQQNGDWSVTARVTAIVTGACTIVTAVLFLVYNYWALKRVKKTHKREMQFEDRDEEEGLGEKINRVVHEPALEPGSVV